MLGTLIVRETVAEWDCGKSSVFVAASSMVTVSPPLNELVLSWIVNDVLPHSGCEGYAVVQFELLERIVPLSLMPEPAAWEMCMLMCAASTSIHSISGDGGAVSSRRLSSSSTIFRMVSPFRFHHLL